MWIITHKDQLIKPVQSTYKNFTHHLSCIDEDKNIWISGDFSHPDTNGWLGSLMTPSPTLTSTQTDRN